MRLFTHDASSSQVRKDSQRLEAKVARKNGTAIGDAGLSLLPNTYGSMVYYRMRLGDGDVSQDPYGFTSDPVVRLVGNENT